MYGFSSGTIAILNHCNTYNSGKIACFNYCVFTHKLESARSLRFKLYSQRWRTSKGHGQSRSRTLQKW